jgi:hypothetical protein
MPIKRKVCRIGAGYVVFLPKSWIELIEAKEHGRVKAVEMEVNGNIKISPILEAQK